MQTIEPNEHETRALRDALVHEARGVLRPSHTLADTAYNNDPVYPHGLMMSAARDSDLVFMSLNLDRVTALRVAALLGDLLGGGR